MLIKCPQCNHDNQLGAIFCRNCGAKLDVESIRPKVVDQRMSDWNFFGIIRRLLGLLILGGLAWVLVMMFRPSAGFAQTLTEDGQEAAKTKFDELMRRLDGGFGKDTYVFTPAEVTYLYNDKFLAPARDAGGGTYLIKSLEFRLDEMNYTHLRLATTLGASIPATFELKGFIPEPVEAQTGVGFSVTKAQMGRMAMPQALHAKIIEKFQPLVAGAELEKILSSVSRVEAKDGQYLLTVKQ